MLFLPHPIAPLFCVVPPSIPAVKQASFLDLGTGCLSPQLLAKLAAPEHTYKPAFDCPGGQLPWRQIADIPGDCRTIPLLCSALFCAGQCSLPACFLLFPTATWPLLLV